MLNSGDRVAVFTGRDYTTIANHGIVLRPSNGSDQQSLVFIPHLNAYCLADDESLLKADHVNSSRVPFAEIEFNTCESDNYSGTYRRLGEPKNSFEFIRAAEGLFGFDVRAEKIDKFNRIEKYHVVVRIPGDVKMDASGCINMLRQILGVEYTKHERPESNSAG